MQSFPIVDIYFKEVGVNRYWLCGLTSPTKQKRNIYVLLCFSQMEDDDEEKGIYWSEGNSRRSDRNPMKEIPKRITMPQEEEEGKKRIHGQSKLLSWSHFN